MSNAFFFTNRDCEYFPCHEGIDPDQFNCLFCFCPLYALGPDCGGNYTHTEKGVKSCVNCSLMHKGEEGREMLRKHFSELTALAQKPQEQQEQKKPQE